VTDRRRVRRPSDRQAREAGGGTPGRPELPHTEDAPGSAELVLQLQRAGGNAAVSALLGGSRPPSRTLQRMWHLDWAALSQPQKDQRTAVHAADPQKKWPSKTKAGFNAELQTGLTYAQANHGLAPGNGPQPAWLGTQVLHQKRKQNGDPDGPPQMKDLYKPGDKKKFKKIWGLVHNNAEGHLPGVVGAGGYKEYYCEPAGGAAANYAADSDHPFGKNRVLLQTNAAGSAYWWATDDHYLNIYFLEDA
jgi:hypothetical protein